MPKSNTEQEQDLVREMLALSREACTSLADKYQLIDPNEDPLTPDFITRRTWIKKARQTGVIDAFAKDIHTSLMEQVFGK